MTRPWLLLCIAGCRLWDDHSALDSDRDVDPSGPAGCVDEILVEALFLDDEPAVDVAVCTHPDMGHCATVGPDGRAVVQAPCAIDSSMLHFFGEGVIQVFLLRGDGPGSSSARLLTVEQMELMAAMLDTTWTTFGFVGMQIQDSEGRLLTGAWVEPVAPAGAGVAYFDDMGLPDPSLTETSGAGVAVLYELGRGEQTFRVRVPGVHCHADGWTTEAGDLVTVPTEIGVVTTLGVTCL